MSSAVGLTSQNYNDDGRSISSETRAAIETEVKKLLDDAYKRAATVLCTHEAEMHALAARLLAEESLSGVQISELIAAHKAGKPTGAANKSKSTVADAASAAAASAAAGLRKAAGQAAQV